MKWRADRAATVLCSHIHALAEAEANRETLRSRFARKLIDTEFTKVPAASVAAGLITPFESGLCRATVVAG